MAQPAVARERLFALRETIARLEGKPAPALAAATQAALAKEDFPENKEKKQTHRLQLGVPVLDEALESGLPLDGITEIRSRLLRDAGAASGLVLALAALLRRRDENDAGSFLPALWIADTVSSMEAGLPYALGLKDFGLQPRHFLHAAPRKLEEALWLAETAIESGAFSATILEVRGNPAHFGLTESRRLSLRAKASGRPLFLLRQAGEEEASSALFRFLAEPAPATARLLPDGSRLGGSIGNPVFRLTLEKSRNAAPLSLLLEWNSHDRRFFSIHEPEHALLSGKQSAHSRPQLSASSNRPDRPKKMGSVLAFDRAS
jgi:protein ImuA